MSNILKEYRNFQIKLIHDKLLIISVKVYNVIDYIINVNI